MIRNAGLSDEELNSGEECHGKCDIHCQSSLVDIKPWINFTAKAG